MKLGRASLALEQPRERRAVSDEDGRFPPQVQPVMFNRPQHRHDPSFRRGPPSVRFQAPVIRVPKYSSSPFDVLRERVAGAHLAGVCVQLE